jgi:glyoxylase-like metal-dependent hydrolase (beta-lactamase superfamily II)
MSDSCLEDFHEDILSKAMHGLRIGKKEMAQCLGFEKSKIEAILNGVVDETLICEMASKLKLDKSKLLRSASKEWFPAPVELFDLRQFNSLYGDMIVNSYLIWDKTTRKTWIFDAGVDANSVSQFLEHETLTLDSIFLTHTHRDHIFCLDEIKEHTGNPKVYTHSSEPIKDSILIEEGFSMNIGRLSLKAFHTHGHSVGGITYVVDGLELPVAIVGDALFAGSMGGGMVSYQDALRTNREKIMTLPDETIICPGHGPMSTIGEEKKYNPFFPEF